MNQISTNRGVSERSVNSLQTLYTVVIALALVEAIKAIINIQTDTNSIYVNWKSLIPFSALVFTLIPFHHGANRYLDEMYIVKGCQGRPLTGLIDFLFFFVEAAVFYIMSLSISQPKLFFYTLTILFVIDIVWLIFVYFSSNESFKKIKYWFWLNLGTIFLLLIFNATKLLDDDINKWIILLLVTLLRTVLDYILEWSFFWPSNNSSTIKNEMLT